MQSGKSLPAPLAVVDSPNDPLASPEEMDSPNNHVAPKPGRPKRRNVSWVAFVSEKDASLQNVAAVEQNPKCKSDHVMAVLLNEPVRAYIEKQNRKGDVMWSLMNVVWRISTTADISPARDADTICASVVATPKQKNKSLA
eukprot:169550_1